MKNLGGAARISGGDRLLDLLTAEFHDTHQAYELFDEFLQQSTFNRHFCLRLLAIARQKTGVAWEIRRLAIVMLEHQILRISPNNFADFDFLLAELQLKPPGLDHVLANSVLAEGYSTTELQFFVVEFRRKLERLNRVHKKIQGRATSDTALHEFIELSRCECKLSLARYLFTPVEIVDRILGQVQVTNGVKDLHRAQPRFVADEIARSLDLLPNFEAEILKRLSDSSRIYWVAEKTSSEINSLVEYPATSVALVVKPPGSDYEFQFKRAGRKGRNSLGVVYARNGFTVPPSHRLDGGSMQYLLRGEAQSASRLAAIYHLVHGTEAPLPKYISRTTIDTIPVQHKEVQTLRYFTEAGIFGDGFPEMRVAMAESVLAFRREGYPQLPDLPGDLGLTAQFVGVVAPSQAILSGTSSFRLNKLTTYLSEDGPERYFKDGLLQAYTANDARRFADAVLEEVLGVYRPPDVSYRNHRQYVDAALRLAANRALADSVYLSLLEQTARFWGTLLAVRAYSRGESFVGRNVGLRSVWDQGQWKVRIIFMDHDALMVPGPRSDDFHAHRSLPSMRIDERYIWDRSDPELFPTCVAGYLESIYRIGNDREVEGRALARRVLKDAYKKTQHELLTNPRLRPFFNQSFLQRLLVFDTLVAGYLHGKPETEAWTTWKAEMKEMLATKGYRQNAFEAYAEIFESNRPFLERYSYLFNSNSRNNGSTGADC